MRALVQRVRRAAVTVDGRELARIGPGLLCFVGVTHDDTEAEAKRLAAKVAHVRVFDDRDGVMNRSVLDAGGAVLVVSQFTLYGDTNKGRRPSWVAAARPDVARPLVERVVTSLLATGLVVETGRFRAHMDVELVNDGPITVSIEVRPRTGGGSRPDGGDPAASS